MKTSAMGKRFEAEEAATALPWQGAVPRAVAGRQWRFGLPEALLDSMDQFGQPARVIDHDYDQHQPIDH